MKFESRYEIGDVVLVKGSMLEIERALTITEILIQAKDVWREHQRPYLVLYGFKESFWHHSDAEILRKIKPT